MKKFTSIFTAVIAVIAILCSSVLPAFASGQWPERTDFKEPLFYVNGVKSNDITDGYEISPESCHYRYCGGGTVTAWEFPTLAEGVDYEILSQGEDDIEFKILNGQSSVPYINVLVDFEHWPIRSNVQDTTAYTNGSFTGHVLITFTPDLEGFRLEYTAEGNVTGWEFPSMTEGKNYEIIDQKDNYIDIKLINGQEEIPDVNVLVDFSNPKGNDNQAINKNENSISNGSTNGQNKINYVNTVVDNAENDAQNMVIICIAVGVCSAAAVGIIVFAVMKKKKNA